MYLELGGVWLCKQPSLVEGLDKTETTVDETIQEQATCTSDSVVDGQSPSDGPSFIQRSLSNDGSEDNVFEGKDLEHEDMNSDTDEEETDPKSGKTSTWLQRAISLCSEGDDIEALASEAENDEYINELNFPRPFSESEENEDTTSHEERELGCKGTAYEMNYPEKESVDKPSDNTKNTGNAKGNQGLGLELKSEAKEQSKSRENQRTKQVEVSEISIIPESRNLNEPSDPRSSETSEGPGDSAKSLKENQKKTEPSCRFDPQDTSVLSVSAGDDYLFAAAKVVRQALNCELDGQYKEAFHLYKKCVSLLLSGVQGKPVPACILTV
jgi:hypothetical protein